MTQKSNLVHETMRVKPETSEAIRGLAAEYGSKGAVVDAAIEALGKLGRVLRVHETATLSTPETPEVEQPAETGSEVEPEKPKFVVPPKPASGPYMFKNRSK